MTCLPYFILYVLFLISLLNQLSNLKIGVSSQTPSFPLPPYSIIKHCHFHLWNSSCLPIYFNCHCYVSSIGHHTWAEKEQANAFQPEDRALFTTQPSYLSLKVIFSIKFSLTPLDMFNGAFLHAQIVQSNHSFLMNTGVHFFPSKSIVFLMPMSETYWTIVQVYEYSYHARCQLSFWSQFTKENSILS